MPELPRGTVEVIHLIAHYSDTMDLVEAEANAQAQLIEALSEYREFNPVELKIIIEQGIQARFDIVVALLIATLAESQGWPVDTHDQEREALKDTLRLVKHHTELSLINKFNEQREAEDEDEEV